jgi:hypothetical protein
MHQLRGQTRRGGLMSADATFTIAGLAFGLACIAAYITHIVWVIRLLLATDGMVHVGRALLALFGVFCPPIGVIHGVMIWFGVGW